MNAFAAISKVGSQTQKLHDDAGIRYPNIGDGHEGSYIKPADHLKPCRNKRSKALDSVTIYVPKPEAQSGKLGSYSSSKTSPDSNS